MEFILYEEDEIFIDTCKKCIFKVMSNFNVNYRVSVIKKYEDMERLNKNRIFIINDKKIQEENIEDIFSSELVKKSSINIPLFYDLKSKLKLYDLIDDNVGTVEEMVDEICR